LRIRTGLCGNATGLWTSLTQISDIENSASRDTPRNSRLSARDARYSSPMTRLLDANLRKCRDFREHPKSLAGDRGGWLGNEDSNLEMTESISVRRGKATVSPPSIRCRCGFSDPGTRAATSHVDALSSAQGVDTHVLEPTSKVVPQPRRHAGRTYTADSDCGHGPQAAHCALALPFPNPLGE
jgi:hypothetical protein